jgi:hypothetical protein
MKGTLQAVGYAVVIMLVLFLGWQQHKQAAERKQADEEFRALLRKHQEALSDPEFLRRQQELKEETERALREAKRLEAEAKRLQAEWDAERPKGAKGTGSR